MFTMIFLGTGAAIPTARRNPSAALLKCEGQRFLVDCGEGAQLRLLQAGESLDVPYVFLTHDHLDHILGLGGLLFSVNLLHGDATRPVAVFGGQATLQRARTLASMIRPHPDMPLQVGVNYVDVASGATFDLGPVTVTAFEARHRPDRICVGYVFESRGPQRIKVVFTGDTAYTEALAGIARGADCLVSEATYTADNQAWATQVGHLTAAEAARIAAAAGVKSLVLTHVSADYEDRLDDVLAEARAIFPKSLLAHDLLVLEVDGEGARSQSAG